jgi:MFS family permease
MLALVLFSVGCAVCGAASSVNMLIAGRGTYLQSLNLYLYSCFPVVQGLGGAGILSLTSIVISDLVSLRERGAYNGLIGLFVFPLSVLPVPLTDTLSSSWAFATAVGPVIGGALANNGQWRWIFCTHLTSCAELLLRLPRPQLAHLWFGHDSRLCFPSSTNTTWNNPREADAFGLDVRFPSIYLSSPIYLSQRQFFGYFKHDIDHHCFD